jgi:hypothetical protein
MTEQFPPNPAPTDDRPVLDYRGKVDAERFPRAPRRHLPPKFGFGFLGTVGMLCVSWPFVAERSIHHVVLFIAVGIAAIGLVMLLLGKSRLAGAGVLCAVVLWFLLVGSCSGIGFVKPGAL